MQVKIRKISTFDATVGTTIVYDFQGQQRSVRLQVSNNNGQTWTAYDTYVNTGATKIDVPANTLANGSDIKYLAKITVYEGVNKTGRSYVSAVASFICIKAPTFKIIMPTNNRVLAASWPFTIQYSSTDGEKLNQWSITLYTRDHQQLSTSGIKYNVDNVVSGQNVTANLVYRFNGFVDNVGYSIRAEGITIHGYEISTQFYNLTTEYKSGETFQLIEAENLPNEGKIHINTNIVNATGEVYTADGNRYIGHDPEVLGPKTTETPDGINILLRGEYRGIDNYKKNGYYALNLGSSYKIVYSEGFTIQGDFQLAVIIWNLKVNQTVLKLGTNVEVFYRVGKFTANKSQACFELVVAGDKYTATEGGKTIKLPPLNDVYFSNVIDEPLNAQTGKQTVKLGLIITRQNKRYNIAVTPNVSWVYAAPET